MQLASGVSLLELPHLQCANEEKENHFFYCLFADESFETSIRYFKNGGL